MINEVPLSNITGFDAVDTVGFGPEPSEAEIKSFEQRMKTQTEDDARDMAEAVNGGSWDADYTEAQKAGWRLKVLWAMERYR